MSTKPAQSQPSLEKDARYYFLENLATVLNEEPHRTAGITATYQFELTGPRGGNFYVRIADGKAGVAEGLVADADVIIRMVDDDYIAMASKRISGSELFMAGKMKVKGDSNLGMKAARIFA